MSANALIRHARASGVALRLEGGKIKARGPRDVITRLLSSLKEQREALVDALQAESLEPLPTAYVDPLPEVTDWHTLDAAYLAHHFSCLVCIAAGRGYRYGQRCAVGAALWRAYAD